MATPKRPARKAAPKRAAAARTRTPKRAAAARAERTPAERSVTYRGLKLTVPPVDEWGSDLYYMTAEWQSGDATFSLAISILEQIIGTEQFELVKAKQREDGVKFVEMEGATLELFNLVFAEFGTSVGESPASASS